MNSTTLFSRLGIAAGSVLDLFFPSLCIVCGSRTHSGEELFCLDCQYHVHPTGMQFQKANEFTERFKGRLQLEFGVSLYYYIKGGRLQKSIELLKYKNCPEIGLRYGSFFGKLLNEIPSIADVDLIIPVPLHPKRRIQRGYNQSYLIAQGIGGELGLNVREDVLVRATETNTQTEKNRMERIQNMLSVFQLVKPQAVWGKHILLVDDILTTGATLEAAARILQTAGPVRISMATLAIAS